MLQSKTGLGEVWIRLAAHFRRRHLCHLYALLFSMAAVFGKKLSVEDAYNGTLLQNYIVPWRMQDGLLILAWFLFAELLLFALLERDTFRMPDGEWESVWKTKSSTLMFFTVFLLWLPYLLRYYPGFIPKDAEVSIGEALKIKPLSNRNPVLYTLFTRLCLFLGGTFDSRDITAGCMLYSILQMLFFDYCVVFLVSWLGARFSLNRATVWGMSFLYGLSPYLAQDSIAMWKDPVFSGSLTIWTLTIADACFYKELVRSGRWRFQFLLFGLMVAFWRNNGILSLLALTVSLFPGVLHRVKTRRERADLRSIFFLSCALCLAWGIVTGPVFRFAGIGGIPREETVGVMLNQMACVAATGGKMSERDRDYLNSLLPMEEYAEKYCPCSVDTLKWDEEFNTENLYSKRFYTTWFSLLMRNPKCYVEAWMLNTYGFWTVNRADVNLQNVNMSYGAICNLGENESLSLQGYTLRFRTFIEDGSALGKLLKADAWSLPPGILNWLLFALILILHYQNADMLMIALAPSAGMALGITAGSPVCILPRYELAVQVLFPLYMLLLLSGQKKMNK